jgi:hypothetical protein
VPLFMCLFATTLLCAHAACACARARARSGISLSRVLCWYLGRRCVRVQVSEQLHELVSAVSFRVAAL